MKEKLTIWQRTKWICKRIAIVFAVLSLTWLLVVLIGLIPVNNDFVETADGVEIMIISNPVHADLVLPIRSGEHDWAEHFPEGCFQRGARMPTHIAIGWGDKGFYIETPTWSDLKVSTAANALLLSSPTCVHVEMFHLPAGQTLEGSQSVKISPEQYQELVSFIQSSFQVDDDGNKVQIADACYGECDAFFEGTGSYHLFNTCNSWVGRGLRSASVRSGIMTPLPGTPTWYLPSE